MDINNSSHKNVDEISFITLKNSSSNHEVSFHVDISVSNSFV